MVLISILNPVSSDQYIGSLPPAVKGPRDKFAQKLNETTSLLDAIFQSTFPKEIETPSPSALIDLYQEPLAHHVEKRVALFFQQLVSCYQTKLHFEAGDTLDQAESAKALMKGKEKICTRNAAHSSTIPCLLAYRGEEWAQWVENPEGEKPQGFVYLRWSDIYRNCNATIDLPRDINEADIAIDGKANESALRNKCLQILNDSSQGTVCPQEGLKRFLDVLLSEVKAKTRAARKEGVKRALELYQETIEEIEEEIGADAEVFSRWLDVRIDQSDESAAVRRTIYHLRYKAIRDNHLGQSEILSKIEVVRKEIFGRIKGEPGRFAYLDEAFRHTLVHFAESDVDKNRLRKLYNLPTEKYDLRPNERRTQLYEATKARMLQEKDKMVPLVKEVSRLMARLRNQETSQRASITRVLRKAKEWRQIDLSAKIKTLYPALPASQPTISRCETGVRTIDPDYAEKLSRVFQVDAGLFMPHFFHD